jgi:hypothetical protein
MTVVGYGGAAPRVRGSVVIYLGKRMNKILDINTDDYTCLLEPGFSFYALCGAIQAKGFDHMWIDVSILPNLICGPPADSFQLYTFQKEEDLEALVSADKSNMCM